MRIAEGVPQLASLAMHVLAFVGMSRASVTRAGSFLTHLKPDLPSLEEITKRNLCKPGGRRTAAALA